MFLNLLLMLLCPFFSFCVALRDLYHSRKRMLIWVSIFMSLCAILSPPFADLAVHARDYADFKNFPSVDLIQTNGKDFILYTISNLFSRLGINFDLIRGLFVFICYQVSFSLFSNLLRARPQLKNSKKHFFCVFLCFFLSVPFIWIVNGLRSATADYLMIYAWFWSTQKDIKKTILFAFLGVGTHFFSWIFVPFLILPFLNIKISRGTYCILFFISLFFGYKFLSGILGSESSNIQDITGTSEDVSNYYLNEFNYSTLSVNGVIALVLERSPILLLVLYSLFLKNKWESNDKTFFYACILLVNLCITYFIPLQRISWLVAPIMIYLYLRNNNINYFFYLLLGSLFLSQLAYVYGYREVLLATPFYYLIFPAPMVLFHTYPLNYELIY